MNILQAIVRQIARAFSWWGNDIKNRKSFAGKAASLGIGLLVFCCACGLISSVVRGTGQAVGLVATNTPSPVPTAVPSPTLTPVPSDTPIPSATPTAAPTDTPQPTTTPTLEPTLTPTLPPKQATAQAKANATATVVALETEFPEVDIRDLAKGPKRYEGQKMRLTGTVFNIKEGEGGFLGLGGTVTSIQMWVQIPGGTQFDREAVSVEFAGTLENVFEDTEILVYGEGAGTMEGKNGFGADISQPLIHAIEVWY